MGDNNGTPAAVTTGELATLLQAMDQRYGALFDAISRQARNARSKVEVKEEIHPLQLPHVKLEGPESYVSWAEHAETILVSRKLDGYILGTVEKPMKENSKEGQKWKMTNALVRAWLLSSLSPQIAKQVERIKEASEIWRLLKDTYSGVGNEMLACKIQKELQELSQGEKTVVDYVSELKRLWSDLDYYDPIELECGKCVEKFHKWTEKRRVRDFLNRLNSKFENRRAAIYGIGKLPNLELAISAILGEETRLKLEDGGLGVNGISQRRSALLAAEGGTFQRPGTNHFDKTCFECGQPGHLRVDCPQLIGGGRGRGQYWRGRGRGRMFLDRGGSRGRSMWHVGRANTSVVEEASQTVSVEMAVDDLEEWHQFKELNIGERQSSEASTSAPASAASANFSGTSEQNGLAERKNRHILEIAQCIMFAMNVPKFLWCEAVMTAAYLMNRMPSRVLDYKTPIECLSGKTTYVVPPKVFGCTCFVKDYRPSVGKLDPRALKCIFVGYSGKQKGYKCWCPSERRMIVSMDVVFREQEPFYGESTDLTDMFPDLFTNNSSDADCEIGREKEEEDNDTTSTKVIIGAVPVGDETEHEQIQGEKEQQEMPNEAARWTRPNEKREIQVYKRRHKIGEQHVQGEETTSSEHDFEAQEQRDMDSLASSQTPQLPSSLDVAGPIPHNWQEAKLHPCWREAMLEEMTALDKNNTWGMIMMG